MRGVALSNYIFLYANVYPQKPLGVQHSANESHSPEADPSHPSAVPPLFIVENPSHPSAVPPLFMVESEVLLGSGHSCLCLNSMIFTPRAERVKNAGRTLWK